MNWKLDRDYNKILFLPQWYIITCNRHLKKKIDYVLFPLKCETEMGNDLSSYSSKPRWGLPEQPYPSCETAGVWWAFVIGSFMSMIAGQQSLAEICPCITKLAHLIVIADKESSISSHFVYFVKESSLKNLIHT